MPALATAALTLPVRPPHEPDDLLYVDKLVQALEDEQELPPVVVFRRADHLQAITGSHRLAAWNRFEQRYGEDRRRFVLLTDAEVSEALASLPRLPSTIDEAWPKLARVGDFASVAHWNAKRPELNSLQEEIAAPTFRDAPTAYHP